jgi:beta-galactosidase
MYASRQEPFLVTETNAQSIGPAWTNQPGYDGQLRQVAWALVSRGARMIEYWQWRSLHFGTETYWGGVLPHNGEPGRIYRELARIGAELAELGDLAEGLTPDVDIAMLYSLPSKWALQAQPPLALPDGGPDRLSYRGIFDPFYRGAFDAGLQMRLLHAGQAVTHQPDTFVARHPVLVVAGMYVADNATLDWLAAYARAGGHLVLGPRSGYADPQARVRPETQPARLARAAGVRYDEYSNLATEVPVRAPDGATLRLPDQAAGTRWADGLQVDGAQVLVEYLHPHFGQWPAATTREYGAGRVTYVGTVPSPGFAEALFRWLLPARHWGDVPAEVTSTGATGRDGRRVRFLHNWAWTPATVVAPEPVRDVLAGTDHAAGEELSLGPWDVRALVVE